MNTTTPRGSTATEQTESTPVPSPVFRIGSVKGNLNVNMGGTVVQQPFEGEITLDFGDILKQVAEKGPQIEAFLENLVEASIEKAEAKLHKNVAPIVPAAPRTGAPMSVRELLQSGQSPFAPRRRPEDEMFEKFLDSYFGGSTAPLQSGPPDLGGLLADILSGRGFGRPNLESKVFNPEVREHRIMVSGSPEMLRVIKAKIEQGGPMDVEAMMRLIRENGGTAIPTPSEMGF